MRIIVTATALALLLVGGGVAAYVAGRKDDSGAAICRGLTQSGASASSGDFPSTQSGAFASSECSSEGSFWEQFVEERDNTSIEDLKEMRYDTKKFNVGEFQGDEEERKRYEANIR